jgi:plastocyanin
VLRNTVIAIAIAVPLALSACGGDDEDPSSTAAATEEATTTAASDGGGGGGGAVEISETEYALDPADPSVSAGEVTFEVTNDGSITHNLEVEGNGVEEEVEDIAPGDNGSLTAELEPGSYEIYCSIGNHKDLGMKGTLTVE